MRRWISALAFPLFRQSSADDFFQNIMADDPSAQRIARTDHQAEQPVHKPRPIPPAYGPLSGASVWKPNG